MSLTCAAFPRCRGTTARSTTALNFQLFNSFRALAALIFAASISRNITAIYDGGPASAHLRTPRGEAPMKLAKAVSPRSFGASLSAKPSRLMEARNSCADMGFMVREAYLPRAACWASAAPR